MKSRQCDPSADPSGPSQRIAPLTLRCVQLPVHGQERLAQVAAQKRAAWKWMLLHVPIAW